MLQYYNSYWATEMGLLVFILGLVDIERKRRENNYTYIVFGIQTCLKY